MACNAWRSVGIVALMMSMTGEATAEGAPAATSGQALWQQECGSCHVPYPPRLLPASSWNAVMDGLGKHFGADASLTPDESTAIRKFLVDHAGRGRAEKNGKPLLRITETPWFVHEHGEELPADIWKRKDIGSPSNCAACHTNAARGRFNESEIRIPGGRGGYED
ncbi:MAG TPA: diheme cytochrome c [Moraxellaceae bacterium]|nr:diheme cytochrome c [Moraxellaceae bacterium]